MFTSCLFSLCSLLQIWDLLEENDLADFPRPVHHRIPNFKQEGSRAGRGDERLWERGHGASLCTLVGSGPPEFVHASGLSSGLLAMLGLGPWGSTAAVQGWQWHVQPGRYACLG